MSVTNIDNFKCVFLTNTLPGHNKYYFLAIHGSEVYIKYGNLNSLNNDIIVTHNYSKYTLNLLNTIFANDGTKRQYLSLVLTDSNIDMALAKFHKQLASKLKKGYVVKLENFSKSLFKSLEENVTSVKELKMSELIDLF